MKRLISTQSLAWIVAIAGTFAVMPAWAELKIGVVDYGKLMEESPQAKTVVDALKNVALIGALFIIAGYGRGPRTAEAAYGDV